MKLKLAVIFGGRACEHDVSVITGLQALQAADPADYETIPVLIAGNGAWYAGDALRNIDFFQKPDYAKLTRVLPVGEDGKLLLLKYPQEGRKILASARAVLYTADAALLAMHGVNGEDGTLSGMLELMDVPYTCSGVLGASAGMDKIAMKKLFQGCGFPVLPMVWAERSEWRKDPAGVLDRAERALGYPVYVKPANLGSSIGISRADDREGLEKALRVAAAFDRRLMIEKGVKKLTEVNCSVLGYAGETRASALEMTLQNATGEFLDFLKKYLKDGKGASRGMKSLARQIPAPIPEEMAERIREISLEAFRVMDCKGVVRIDYILDGEDGALYINEINTIPGSLAFYLWDSVGLKFSRLIDEMVRYAFQAAADRRENVFSYESTLLTQMRGGKAGGKLKA